MQRQIAWRALLVESVVIAGSIFGAFALDAWWEGQQEEELRTELLADLRMEIEDNRHHLAEIVGRLRERGERFSILDEALQSDPPAISRDSLSALSASTRVTPTFDPSFGVLNLLIQSGELTLVEDPLLRRRLAGLEGRMKDLLGNAEVAVAAGMSPEVLYGSTDEATNQLIRQGYRRFQMRQMDLMVRQGEALSGDLDEILDLLARAGVA